MVFNVTDFDVELKKPRAALSAEDRKRYRTYYLEMFPKLGIRVEKDNREALYMAADFFGEWWAGKNGKADFPERGLFIFGAKGTGKTSVMQRFSALFGVEFISVWDLGITFAAGGMQGFWEEVKSFDNAHLIIDDLGNETAVRSFGNELPMPDLIRHREVLYRAPGPKYTFFTSNFTDRKGVISAYGDTVFSRIAGMCDFLEFRGRDWRLERA